MVFASLGVQRYAAPEGLGCELHDRAAPAEGEPVDFFIAEIAQQVRLLQRDAESDQHVEFAGDGFIGRQAGEFEVATIEFGDKQCAQILLFQAVEQAGHFWGAVGQLAEAYGRVIEVGLLIGVKASQPVRSDLAIEVLKVIHGFR